MKKSFQSRSTCTDDDKLPKINSLRKIHIKRQYICLKKNLNFSRNQEIDIKNNNNETEEFNMEDVIDVDNKISGIFSYENKNDITSNKKLKEIDIKKKKKSISSYFINDFNNKIFLKKKVNSIIGKEGKKLKKKKINILIFPQVTKEKLEEIKSRKIKKLVENKKDKMIFKKMLEKYKEGGGSKIKNKINKYNLDFQIAVSKKKALSILEDIGKIELNNNLINNMKKNDFPKKDIHAKSSYTIKSYQNKIKNDKIQKKSDKKENYIIRKIRNYMEENNSGNGYIKLLKIFNERKLNKVFQKLNKSKSSINIIEKKRYSLPKKENEKNINNTNIYYPNFENAYTRFKTINMKLKNKSGDLNKNNSNIIKYNNRFNRNNEKLFSLFSRISLNKNFYLCNLEKINDSKLYKSKKYLHKSYDVSIDKI